MEDDTTDKEDGKSISLSANNMQGNKDVENLLSEALRVVLEEMEDERSDDEIVQAMTSTCAEFMKSFIIIGYDLNDNAIPPIFHAKTDMEADALSQYMQHYFMASMKGQH